MRTTRVILDPEASFLPSGYDALLAHLGIRARLDAGDRAVNGFTTVDGRACFLKFDVKSHPFAPPTLLKVSGPWRIPERLKEFRNLVRLRREGLHAPRPLAFAEERRFGVMTQHLLLLERVPDARDLSAILADGTLTDERRADLLFATGRAVGRMHRAGFMHRDLYARNVLVTGEVGRDAVIWFLDCRKGTWSRWQPRREAYDLGCFDLWGATILGPEARVAFFAGYEREARPASLERLLDATEAYRRQQVARHLSKRDVHQRTLPRADAPPVDIAAVRAFDRASPQPAS